MLSAGAGGYLSVNAEALATSAPLDQLFSWPPDGECHGDRQRLHPAFRHWWRPGCRHHARAGAPRRLENKTNTINGSGYDAAYPAETQTLSGNGAVTLSAWGNVADILLEANATSSSVTTANMYPSQLITIAWRQDGTGHRAYAWPPNCKFAGGTPPASSTAPGAVDAVTFYYDRADLIQAT